jgi:hypothetical protein
MICLPDRVLEESLNLKELTMLMRIALGRMRELTDGLTVDEAAEVFRSLRRKGLTTGGKAAKVVYDAARPDSPREQLARELVQEHLSYQLPFAWESAEHEQAFGAYLSQARNPSALVATIASHANGMHGTVSAGVIGRALLDMSAANEPFKPALFAGYIRRQQQQLLGGGGATAPKSFASKAEDEAARLLKEME